MRAILLSIAVFFGAVASAQAFIYEPGCPMGATCADVTGQVIGEGASAVIVVQVNGAGADGAAVEGTGLKLGNGNHLLGPDGEYLMDCGGNEAAEEECRKRMEEAADSGGQAQSLRNFQVEPNHRPQPGEMALYFDERGRLTYGPASSMRR